MRRGQDEERTAHEEPAAADSSGATGRAGLARRQPTGDATRKEPTGDVEIGADRAATAAPTTQLPRTGEPSTGERSAVGWVALLVAALITAWQIVFAISHQGLEPDDQATYTAVSLFVTLVLSVGAMVLGLVALSQRRAPRWPAIVGLAVGAQVFLVTVATWVGDLANSGVG